MLCADTGGLTLFIHVIKNFIKIRNQGSSASNLTCTHRYYRIPLLLQFLIISFAWCKADVSFSVKTNLTDSSSLAKHVVFKTLLKRNILGKIFEANTRFCIIIYVLLIYTTLCIWTCNLLLLSGDIHPNPGPASTASTLSFSSSQETVLSFSPTDLNLTNLANHLSFVHYNVQSLRLKLDLIAAELCDFDILAFSETWLNPSVSTTDLYIQSYREPERKDRIGDSHGGVVLYVKNTLYYRRRADLELRGIECIWIELGGLFYRPPNADAVYYSAVEDSIHLASDSGIHDIVITGDFNFNMFNSQSSRKINSICEQLSFSQMIQEPTHFTEHSSSLIDILIVSNKRHVINCGVSDPFLHQDTRYHCPIYGILIFCKPKRKAFKRRIWKYEQGNYDLLRQTAAETNWNSLRHNDINIYEQNIKEYILSLIDSCIPNKVVTIRPSDLPWITTAIKRQIRKRKRAYRKAKLTDEDRHWVKFRMLRNKVISMIRESKKSYNKSLSDKLVWISVVQAMVDCFENFHFSKQFFLYTPSGERWRHL